MTVELLDEGRPVSIDTEHDRIGRGAWARLFASSAVRDEGSSTAERGRTLAREGAVHSVTVAEGVLTARVDGGVERTVTISAPPVPPRIWSAVSRSTRGNRQLEAAVEGRGQSVHLEHVLTVDWEEPLVPAPQTLVCECDCGDAPGCAHVAALAYVFADQIDRDPGLLLRWRGCIARDETPVWLAPDPEPEPALAASGDIWAGGPLPELGPPRPLPTAAVLKRLGPSGIQVGAQDLAEVLQRAYASFAGSGRS
ncbi:MAG: hypothetical protein ACXWZB_07345 [Gaiellaceae bacterium]